MALEAAANALPRNVQEEVNALNALEGIKVEKEKVKVDPKDEKLEKPVSVNQIERFDNSTDKLPGYATNSALNFRSLVPEFLKRKKSEFNTEDFTLGRPSVRGDHFVIATDNVTAKEHHICIVNHEVMRKSVRANPIVAHFTPKDNEFVRDIQWAAPNMIIGGCGQGNIQVFTSTDKDPYNFSHAASHNMYHHKPIREIAVNPKYYNEIVTGGYCKLLQYLVIREGGIQGMGVAKHNNVITGINFSPDHPDRITVNSDEGGFYIYDARSTLKKPHLYYQQVAKDECFCHEMYTEYNFMLGFGSGEIQHYDTRSPKKMLHRVQDPYVVDGVGDIIFDKSSSSFLVTGFTDFSVWRQDPQSLEAKIWSHSKSTSNVGENVDGYQCGGAYLNGSADKPTVVIADSEGRVGLYTQNFNA